jgi:excisionase family DNA binding protein
MLSTPEAAAYLSVPYETFRRRYTTWGIPSYNYGRARKFREDDLITWRESRKVAA